MKEIVINHKQKCFFTEKINCLLKKNNGKEKFKKKEEKRKR